MIATVALIDDLRISINDYDSLPQVKTEDALYWLNKATRAYIRSKYDGINELMAKYNELHSVDRVLDYLTKTDTLSLSSSSGNKYIFDLDDATYNIQYIVREKSTITISAVDYEVAVIDSDNNRIDEDLSNPFSEHVLQGSSDAKPIRSFTDNKAELYSDGNYRVKNYIVTYIKEPNVLTLSTDSDLPSYSSDDIVDMAARMYYEFKQTQ